MPCIGRWVPDHTCLFYRYEQPDGPPPAWFVMPAVHRTKHAALAAALDARYTRHEIDGVIGHRLRTAGHTNASRF
jgi:hypothetical protein